MSHTLKVLVAGSVFGKYTKLFKRVSDVNTKAGPFDLLLCIGDFFGDDVNAYNELLNGSTDLPNVPTYILGRFPHEFRQYHSSVDNFEEGFELVDGITFLGRSGVLTTSQGLRIGYLNGTFSEELANKDDDLEYFTKKEYDSLLAPHMASSSIMDILLTNQWPEDIFKYTNSNLDESIIEAVGKNSADIISQLVNLVQPRYHFAGGLNIFYERAPFRNHRVLVQTAKHVTRFLSIADITNTQKMKWIYAFNIVPSKHLPTQELIAQPPGTTENPFTKLLDDKREMSESWCKARPTSGQFFFAVDSSDNPGDDGDYSRKRRNDGQHQREPKKQFKVEQDQCWFCLASPNVDKSLIVSIGEFAYLALAKGGLSDDHMMILPIEHIRSSIEIEVDSLRAEIDRFKQALIDFFKKRDMVPVFFERNFRTPHFQIHVIGLPESKAPSLKEAVATVFARHEFHELSLHSDLVDVISPGIPYFYFECPQHYRFFVRINTKKEFFPIQIGRELLAHDSLLNCPERVDWKQCTSTEAQAKELTRQIRADFKEFDFTL